MGLDRAICWDFLGSGWMWFGISKMWGTQRNAEILRFAQNDALNGNRDRDDDFNGNTGGVGNRLDI